MPGVTFEGRQHYVSRLKKGYNVHLKRDLKNKYDSNAIAVYDNANHQIGWIPRDLAAKYSMYIDEKDIKAYVVSVGIAERTNTYGCTIRVYCNWLL